MKRFCILSTAIVLVTGAGIWLGYHLGRSLRVSSEPKIIAASSPVVSYFGAVVDRLYVSRFEANDIPMNDALAQIERQFNETPLLANEGIRVRIINRNLCEKNVTIVLRDASLISLLNLISEQTHFEYRIDVPNKQIMFFSNTDTIGGDDHVDDGTQESPDVLPPPR